MRIVKREEFLKLPINTLYRKYKPQFYEDLCIKGETWDSDFLCQELHGDISGSTGSDHNSDLHDMAVESGGVFRFDLDGLGRDGLYDENQLFAIYDNEDIKGLIEKLKICLR